MIRMTPIQNGHRLEVTINRDVVIEAQALDVVVSSLKNSRHDSHQAILAQIEKQGESSMSLVRFTLNTSAAGRIEAHLRYVFSKRRLYPNRGYSDLHEAIGRVLNIRRSEALAS